MAKYPIKMLKDEEGNPFVPLINIDAIKELGGESLMETIEGKLEVTNIIAGRQIDLDVDGNNITINNSSEGTKLINNLNTAASGTGALDAAQGKVLKDSIPEVINNLTTIDSKKALSAHQGYVLAGRVAPVGGATGQVLKKASDSDYSFEWGDAADPNAIVGDGSIMKIVELSYEEYLELEAANQLQDDTEYHINDWNENERTYLTDDDIQKKIENNIINNTTSSEPTKSLSAAQGKILNDKISSLSTVASTGSYNDLINKPDRVDYISQITCSYGTLNSNFNYCFLKDDVVYLNLTYTLNTALTAGTQYDFCKIPAAIRPKGNVIMYAFSHTVSHMITNYVRSTGELVIAPEKAVPAGKEINMWAVYYIK